MPALCILFYGELIERNIDKMRSLCKFAEASFRYCISKKQGLCVAIPSPPVERLGEVLDDHHTCPTSAITPL